jgi:hypothetical protein
MKHLLWLFFLVGCSSVAPDFELKQMVSHSGRIYFYWPYQWQSQWGKYLLSINDDRKIILKNKGFYSFDVKPGLVKISSKHFQFSKFKLSFELRVQKGKEYFFKLDTKPKEVTLLNALGDIATVTTVINGIKSHQRLKEGKGSLQDASNHISAEKQKLESEHNKKIDGFHTLEQKNQATALLELNTCCSSKNVERIK